MQFIQPHGRKFTKRKRLENAAESTMLNKSGYSGRKEDSDYDSDNYKRR
jgi:hypothetical protein